MTTKFPGITFIKCREKLGLRLRREPNFDRSLTTSDLLWDKPEDQEKLRRIISNSINETEWKPHNAMCMKRLYINLYSKLGKNKGLQETYKHINPTDLFEDRLPEQQRAIDYVVPKDDAILTELRLIRNYLEKLTLLQEVK
jgi:hypothetical protein